MDRSSWRARKARRWAKRLTALLALAGLFVAVSEYTTLFWQANESPLNRLPVSAVLLMAITWGAAAVLVAWLLLTPSFGRSANDDGGLNKAGLRVADLDLHPIE